MQAKVAAIICAAGASKRFGGKRNKPFVQVAGRAVFLRSIELFAEHPAVKQTLLGIPEDQQEFVRVKWSASLKFFGVEIYIGGKKRCETVARGLSMLKDDIDLVAVHDAARCCVRRQWVDAAFEKADKYGSAIVASAVTDTIKQIDDGFVKTTIDRTKLYNAQTPQVFRKDLLQKAYAQIESAGGNSMSDDAQLLEAMGERIAIVLADSSNIKITRQSDIPIVEAVLRSRQKKPVRPLGPYEEAQW